MKGWIILALGVSAAVPASGETVSHQTDMRIREIEYLPDQIFAISTIQGGKLTIVLARDERIATVRLSDPASYEVIVPAAADGLLLRQLRASDRTMMAVETDQHHYDFVLSSSPDGSGPYLVLFNYPEPVVQKAVPVSSVPADSTAASYKVTGNRELRPQSVSDDGLHTYIRWGQDQAVPAVFAIDRLGREQMVEGYMRDEAFTIDRVYDRLIFRIDNAVATARRLQAGRRRP